MNTEPKRAAFTLVELLIVVIVIAVIAAIAVPKFMSRKHLAKEIRLKQDLKTLRTAIEVFHLDTGGWPTQLVDLARANHPATMYDDRKPPSVIAWPGGLPWRGPYVANAHACPIGDYEYDVASPANRANYAVVASDSDNISSEGTPYSSW